MHCAVRVYTLVQYTDGRSSLRVHNVHVCTVKSSRNTDILRRDSTHSRRNEDAGRCGQPVFGTD